MGRLVIIAVWALSAAALAANPKATQLAKDADRLYKDGKYREAAETLKQAYELDKNPVFIFNIARAYDQAGDLQIALDTYRDYIGLPDNDPQLVKRANLAMDRLRALVARGAADKEVQEKESKRLKDDAEASRRKADEEAERGRRQKEEFDARDAARAREQNKGASVRRIAAFVLGGLALAGVGVGVGFGLSASGSKSAFTTAATLDDKQRLEAQTRQSALIADLGLAAALAFAITFAIVFPWSSPGSSEVSVALGPSGAALAGTF